MQCLACTNGKAIVYKLFVLAMHSAFYYFVAAIKIIVEQWVAYVFHVYPYLMSTAGFQNTLHQCYIIKALQHPVMCNGFLAMFPVRVGFKQFSKPLVAAHMCYN